MKLEYRFTSPLNIVLPRKTKKDVSKGLNLNTYRNINFIMNNQMKVIYKQDFSESLSGLVITPPIKVTYTYFSNSNRKSDISNMCCIVDKFFLDALTEFGCIPDDNYEYVKEVHYLFGGVDKGKGRVEILIEEIGET